MRPNSPNWIKQIFGILVFLLLVHIFLSLAIIFSPAMRQFFEKYPITHYYKDYAAIGPFFTANSLRSSHDIAASYKGTEWSKWVFPIRENHEAYLSSGSFSSLKRARYESFLTGRLYIKPLTEQSDDRIYVLNYIYARNYFAERYAPAEELVDSIKILILKDSIYQSIQVRDTIKILKHPFNNFESSE